jgi:hypothetical protein
MSLWRGTITDYNEYITDFLQSPEKYYHRVIWYIGAVKVGKKKFSLGYCTYGKGIAFITDNPLASVLIDRVSVLPPLDDGTPGYCSDGKWCINSKCPFSSGKKRPGVNVEEIEEKLKETGHGFEGSTCGNVLFKKPVIELRYRK